MALDLNRRIGPLPIWGWGAAGLAGVGIAWWLRRRPSAGGEVLSTAPDLAAADIIGGSTDLYPVDVTGAPPVYSFPIPSPSPIPSPAPVPVTGGGCTKPTKPADCKRWAPRCCPNGWHVAQSGPCAGRCVPNVGGG